MIFKNNHLKNIIGGKWTTNTGLCAEFIEYVLKIAENLCRQIPGLGRVVLGIRA